MNENTTSLDIDEAEIIRLVLQFLSSRELYKSARNLERESGITNSDYNEDVLFLRQLILDGEWDAVFSYGEPLEKLEGFDSKTFRYLILKQKFMEILYVKSGVDGAKSSYSIDDMIKCLSQLEKNCPAKSEYMKLCWLLTVPDLYDQPEYANWNPESARRKCFSEIVKLVKNIMPIHKKKGEKSLPSLSKDRLANLIAKGLCFESCVFYCIQRVKNDEVKGLPQNVNDINMLYGVSHDNTGNFLSWLQSLPQDSFCNHFDALSFKVDYKKANSKVKQHLSTKRLQSVTENLSKSISLSSRPSTASKVEAHTRMVPDSLTGVKNVANSYANFQFTKQTEQQSNPEKVESKVSLDGDSKPQTDKIDIARSERELRHVATTATSTSDATDNNLHYQDRNAQTSVLTSVVGKETPKKDGRLTSSKREVRDSQDSLDQVKKHQESSVLKQLENHERQQAERRRLLMETSNLPTSEETSNHSSADSDQANIRHPSDGHSLHLNENQTGAVELQDNTTPVKHSKPSHENKPTLPTKRMQRESPLGKEPSPPCKDYPEAKTPITSTPLSKKRSVPEPLNLDNISVSRIKEHKESSHGNDSDLNQSDVVRGDGGRHNVSQHPKTPMSNILHPGHGVVLANGSGVLNTSTPKSNRQKMSNTPGPPESPVGVVDVDDKQESGLINEDKAGPVIPNADTPSARRGPKINGVRRTLSSNGPPMARNKGSPTPNEEVQEKATKQTKPSVAKNQDVNSPRDRSNQKQTSNKKISRGEEEHVTPNNIGSSNQTYLKQTTNKHGSPSTQPTQHQDTINKLFTRQQGYMKNNADTIRFCPVASLEDVQAIRAVAFHPAGDLFAVGSNSKALRLCAATGLTTYQKMNSNEDMIPPQPTILFKRNNHHRGSIYCVAWNDTGDMIATGSNDKTIKLAKFDVENCTVLPEVMLNIHGGTIRDLTFATRSCGTTVLVSGSAENGDIKISDINTGKPLGKLTGHLNHIMSIFAAKDDIIVSGSYDNTVRLWDLRSQRCIDAIVPGKSCVVSVCVNPAGTLLASGDEDGGCMIYDITAGRSLQFFKPHTSDCRSVRFSPDGHYLLTASYDTTISLVDMQCNLECSIPPYSMVAQHRDKVIQCRWHPQLMSFVSSSADKTASLWTLDC